MSRGGLRSIPSGSNHVVAARSNARANTGHSRFATDGVPWPASRSRACLCPPFTGTRARPPAAFFQVPRAAYRAIAGPLHRCARPWSPCSGARTCVPVVRTVRRLRQCPRGAMEAERIGHAVARRTSDAIAPRPSEDRMATGRRRLNHRSTSGWTLARHAGCHAALLLHRLTAHSSLMRINLVPRIGFFLGHV